MKKIEHIFTEHWFSLISSIHVKELYSYKYSNEYTHIWEQEWRRILP